MKLKVNPDDLKEEQKVRIRTWQDMALVFKYTPNVAASHIVAGADWFIPEMEQELPEDRIVTLKRWAWNSWVSEKTSEWAAWYITPEMIEEIVEEPDIGPIQTVWMTISLKGTKQLWKNETDAVCTSGGYWCSAENGRDVIEPLEITYCGQSFRKYRFVHPVTIDPAETPMKVQVKVRELKPGLTNSQLRNIAADAEWQLKLLQDRLSRGHRKEARESLDLVQQLLNKMDFGENGEKYGP